MLPLVIIEQIRKREEEERLRHDAERPRVELPIPRGRPPVEPVQDSASDEEEVERGVVILEV